MSANHTTDAQSSAYVRRVVVVGGGFAGLACAYELQSAGCKVLVLEARDRVGGRVCSRTDLIEGKVVEAGGELLGSNHPTVIDYATRFGLRFLPIGTEDGEPPVPLILNGHRLSPAEVVSVVAELELAFELLTELARTVDLECPWLMPDAERLDRTSLATWLNGTTLSKLGKLMVEAYFTSNNSVPIDQQSLLGNLLQIRGGGLERYWLDTEVYRCEGGNQQFAIKLVEAIGEQQVKLKSPVTSIDVHSHQVTVTEQCGTKHVADEVVLAIPPSLWHRVHIDPPLPYTLTPQMGAAVKFLSTVSERFWTKQGLPPSAFVFSNVEPLATAGNVWWGTEHQTAAVASEGLVSFVSGPAADRWSQWSEPDRIREYVHQMDLVQTGFTDAVRRSQFIDWITDNWSLGSYSFPAPGQIMSQGPVLRRGLGRLHFAGEHTCYPFVGYMEGALQSGVSLAKRICSQPHS